MRNLPLYEQWLNEIGDSSVKAFPWKVVTSYKKYFDECIEIGENHLKSGGESMQWIPMEKNFEFEIKGEKAVYTAVMICSIHRRIQLMLKPGAKRDSKRWTLECSFHFDIKGSKKEINTNLNEHFQLMAALTECAIDFIHHASEVFKLDRVDINAKADDSDEEAKLDSKRGRLYLAYIKGNIRKLQGDWTAELTQYGVTLKSGRWSTNNTDQQAKMFYNK
jgi:hypothetical protein